MTALLTTSARCSPSSPAAGQNDSGMFETNLRDERFLPFEGAGAESTWKLDLPKDYRAFDYDTISDVILHIRYTARQGVEPGKVKAALDALFQQATQSNLALLFSLRHDFPTEWAALVNGTAANPFAATIRRDSLPLPGSGKGHQNRRTRSVRPVRRAKRIESLRSRRPRRVGNRNNRPRRQSGVHRHRRTG